MMRAVGMFEAKTHFPKIMEEATIDGSDGICITNRGREIGVIISMEEYRRYKKLDFWKRWEAFKTKHPIGTPEEVIKFRDEGRKWI